MKGPISQHKSLAMGKGLTPAPTGKGVVPQDAGSNPPVIPKGSKGGRKK